MPLRRRRRVRKLRLAALLGVLVVLAGLSFSFGLVRAVASEIPALDPAAQRSDIDSVVYAANGKSVLAVLRGDESRVLVSTEDIAPIMRQAIVATEDQRFFDHDGIDVRGVARALWADVRNQAIVEGGSTITQQFVKNAYIRNERTLARKVREAALAWQLEQRWSKDRILTAYLNTIYFGNGAYGIQQASRAYFKKGAKELDLAEAALLAGIPADPSRYDPVTNPASAKQRRRYVLTAMLDQGKITRRDFRRANAAPLPDPEDVHLPGTQGPAQYFVNYVKDQLVAEIRSRACLRRRSEGDDDHRPRAPATRSRGGREGAAESRRACCGARRDRPANGRGQGDVRRQELPREPVQPRRSGRSPAGIGVQAHRPRDGDARGDLAANRARVEEGVDRRRRPDLDGHELRPHVSRARHLCNARSSPPTTPSTPSSPISSARRRSSRRRMRSGSRARSTRTSRSASAPSPSTRSRWRGRIRRSRTRAGASTARCSATRPASSRASSGYAPHRVEENSPQPTEVTEPGEAETLTSILQDVVRFGTGTRAAVPGIAVAGKTGTTDNYGDAWFVGYTPELAVAVWVGYPDRLRPMTTEFEGEPVTGGTLPGADLEGVRQSLREGAGCEEERMSTAPSTPPPYLGSSSYRVVKRGGEWKLDNGYCRGTRVVAYFSGHAPDESADCKPNEVDVPLVVGNDGGRGCRTPREPAPGRAARVQAGETRLDPRCGREPDSRAREASRRATRSPSSCRRRATACCRTSSGRASRPSAPSSTRRKLRWRIVTAPGHTANRSPTAPRSRGRLCTGPPDHARGRGRLTNREPSREYRHG